MEKLRSILVVSVCLALLLLAGCGAKYVKKYEAGMAEFEDGKLGKAEIALLQVASGRSLYACKARYYVGECYRLQTRWEEAIEQFQMAADADPESHVAAQARIRIEQIQKGTEDAARAEEACMNSRGDAEAESAALLEMGLVYEKGLDDYSRAIQVYQQLVRDFPGTERAAKAQMNIGSIYMYKIYDYTMAFDEFRKVNADNYPKQEKLIGEVENLLLEFNAAAQRIKENQEFVQVATGKIDARQREAFLQGKMPSNPSDLYGPNIYALQEVQFAISRDWVKLKNYPRAIENHRWFIDRWPLMLRQTAQARYAIAEIYQLQENYLEAIDSYQIYLDSHPTDFRRNEAVYNMGLCYERLRMFDEAYARYRAYCEEYPEGKLIDAARRKAMQYEPGTSESPQ